MARRKVATKAKAEAAPKAIAPAPKVKAVDPFIALLGARVLKLLTDLGVLSQAQAAYKRLTKALPPGVAPSDVQVRAIVDRLIQPGLTSAIADALGELVSTFVAGKGKVKRGRTAHA